MLCPDENEANQLKSRLVRNAGDKNMKHDFIKIIRSGKCPQKDVNQMMLSLVNVHS